MFCQLWPAAFGKFPVRIAVSISRRKIDDVDDPVGVEDAQALHEIRQKGKAMGLPDTAVARAANLYKSAVEKRVTMGRNAQRIMAGCFLA
mgnify:CR=1 FL=1